MERLVKLAMMAMMAMAGPATAVVGDLNRDGTVNLLDFFLLADNFGVSGNPDVSDCDGSKVEPGPELDTTIKRVTGNWTIQYWDGEDWRDTADKSTVSRSWRFISYTDTGSQLRIKGGYTLVFTNPTNYDVEFVFGRLDFEDRGGIPIYIHEFSRITRFVSAWGGTDTYSGNFEIYLDNIDIANEITKMIIWGRAYRPL